LGLNWTVNELCRNQREYLLDLNINTQMPHPEEVKKHGYVKQKSFNLMKKLSSIDDEVK